MRWRCCPRARTRTRSCADAGGEAYRGLRGRGARPTSTTCSSGRPPPTICAPRRAAAVRAGDAGGGGAHPGAPPRGTSSRTGWRTRHASPKRWCAARSARRPWRGGPPWPAGSGRSRGDRLKPAERDLLVGPADGPGAGAAGAVRAGRGATWTGWLSAACSTIGRRTRRTSRPTPSPGRLLERLSDQAGAVADRPGGPRHARRRPPADCVRALADAALRARARRRAARDRPASGAGRREPTAARSHALWERKMDLLMRIEALTQ